MPNARELCDRWTTELRAGRPVAVEIVTDDFVGHWPGHDVHGPDELQRIIQRTRNMVPDLTFAVQIGPLSDGDFVAGRWVGEGRGDDGPISFSGNDILRISGDRQRFGEYWTGASTG